MKRPRSFMYGLLLLACELALMSSGCATTGGPKVKPRPFSAVEVEQLRVGTPVQIVRRQFGTPYKIYVMEFGEFTDRPWTGIVYEYVDVRDPRFAYQARYFKNRLVLAAVGQDTLLNNWVIEKNETPIFVSKKSPRTDTGADRSPR